MLIQIQIQVLSTLMINPRVVSSSLRRNNCLKVRNKNVSPIDAVLFLFTME